MYRSTLTLLLLLCMSYMLCAQEYTGAEAEKLVSGAENVWLKAHTRIPAYVRFSENHRIPRPEFEAQFRELFQLNPLVDGWRPIRADKDALGHYHERFEQSYQGIPVEGGNLILHSENEEVYAINGHYFRIANDVPMQASLSEKAALRHALKHIGAESYKWQIAGEEAHLRRRAAENPQYRGKTTHYPKGELVLAPIDGDYKSSFFHLTWKFDIYAHAPLSRQHVFVDAQTGKVVYQLDMLHTADSAGTAHTRYSGVRPITADRFMGGFRLREAARGQGIRTWNMQQGTDRTMAVDFTDADNVWNNANPQLDEAAGDAHWGAEMTYDYFFKKHGWNSIDNMGYELNSYVHYGQNFNNAFWDGTMNYGDGNNNPFTALDIAGHEISHGLTNFSANLIYRNESGALNESFSDIFGKAIEQYARPNNFSWTVGDDLGNGIRNMADPWRFNDPRNYKGTFWYTGTADNGGVHTNSGVQNYWFQLLIAGGSGTNDFAEAYTVSPMGFDTAAAIAFRNLTVYLDPTSEYIDARRFAIQSAIDLYGTCSDAHKATTNAWHAAGVGRPFSTIPVSDFAADQTALCSAPYTVKFEDLALSAASYRWDFGDGNTDTLSNPTHTYQTHGTYSVKLTITGYCGGGDTTEKVSYITISKAPDAPTFAPPSTLNCGMQTSITASVPTGGDTYWYDQAGEVIHQGATFSTPVMTAPLTYYVQNVVLDTPSQKVGPPNNSFGGGGYFNRPNFQGQVFEVKKRLRLESVWVNAQGTRNRNIQLRDDQGNTLRTATVMIPDSISRVQLGWDIAPGRYVLGGSNMNLYRNNNGPSYPYEIPGLISILQSTANQSTNFYYFFYDWEINTFCSSARIPVLVNVNLPAGPQVADQMRCGAGSVTFAALSVTGSHVVNWYDADGTYLHSGNNFTTPVLNTTTDYQVETEEVGSGTIQKVGPTDGSIGGGGYHNNGFAARIFFEVYSPIRIRSVWVDAASDGIRDIELEDDAGNNLVTLQRFIPAGQSRINLWIDLQPGTYAIGGSNMDLYRNNNGAQFPYTLAGLLSLTGTSAGQQGFYYYFYDWEIQAAPCVSPRKTITATVDTVSGPTTAFFYNKSGATFSFIDRSVGATSWHWDFGDGNTSTQQNPIHSYTSPGSYTVTLLASDSSSCSKTYSRTVWVDIGAGIEAQWQSVKWQLYPNPGQGSFIIATQLDQAREVSISVYDLTGRELLRTSPETSKAYRKQIQLGEAPAGAYIVKMQLDDQSFYRKYILTK